VSVHGKGDLVETAHKVAILGRWRRSEGFATRVVVELVVGSIGLALIVFAFVTDNRWLDRHFLPTFFVSRRVYELAAACSRTLIAANGVALALVARPRIGRRLARVPARRLVADIAAVSLAVVLSLGTSEVILRHIFWRATEERPANEEPSRRRDQRLGWTFAPAHTGRDIVDGRVIDYAFDANGYRVRSVAEPVDHERPTIIFAGESIMVGHGLNWDETIPAQVEALLGVQSANLAVSGFATDQAYLRLQAELPRFRQPVAVVSLFTPALFDRNLDDDRPHLGPGLVWLPAQSRWRLTSVARWLVPYRSDEVVERGISVTREVLRATVDLAHARGAIPLIVVPQFAPEGPVERMLRLRIVDQAGLPYVWVELDPNWRVPGEGHPDQRGTRAIAGAIAGCLQEGLRDRPSSEQLTTLANPGTSPERSRKRSKPRGTRREEPVNTSDTRR
jgi:hypothetical protein